MTAPTNPQSAVGVKAVGHTAKLFRRAAQLMSVRDWRDSGQAGYIDGACIAIEAAGGRHAEKELFQAMFMPAQVINLYWMGPPQSNPVFNETAEDAARRALRVTALLLASEAFPSFMDTPKLRAALSKAQGGEL